MRRLAALLLLFAGFVPTLVSAKPLVALKLSGAVMRRAADGKVVATPLEKAAPKTGDEIVYDIVASNGGNTPAARLQPTGKIPAGTAYVAASAKAANARVEFSLDNGKTWSTLPMVDAKNAAGVVERRPADVTAYTAIRWNAADALRPGAAAHFVYEVRVK